jgi:hypothetical protein
VIRGIMGSESTPQREGYHVRCSVQEENDSIPRCYIRDPFGVVFNIGQARAEK